MKKKIIMIYCYLTMDIFSNFENLNVFFKDENNTKLLVVLSEHVFFHKQNILYINICFKKHVEENLFNLMHV